MQNNLVLLEETGLTIPHINETTLIRWYKDTNRRSEITTLLRGKTIVQRELAKEALPTAKELHFPSTSSDYPPNNVHKFVEQQDTLGRAILGHATMESKYAASMGLPCPILLPIKQELGAQKTISRTTEWRKRKREIEAHAKVMLTKNEDGREILAPPLSEVPSTSTDSKRKVYSCKLCSLPMSAGEHTQFRGQRYCPTAPGALPKDAWLALKRLEAAEKKNQCQ